MEFFSSKQLPITFKKIELIFNIPINCLNNSGVRPPDIQSPFCPGGSEPYAEPRIQAVNGYLNPRTSNIKLVISVVNNRQLINISQKICNFDTWKYGQKPLLYFKLLWQ